ncbi:hydrogenase expression/formation protein HypE [Alteromonas sp. CYL-A6]|uniref:hydrogenase expression/formation protein HypE n=1 Tax=Alteromonas nitratireducens TaxID=3390813 RepID=UPI0034C41CCC
MKKDDVITLAHGAGGRASEALYRDIFYPAFGLNGSQPDAAAMAMPELAVTGSRLAMTTDSFVVSPLTFPGGDIGKLSVCGTVNDLAVSGARPRYLSAGFVIEEGLPLSILTDIARSMARAASEAGVSIVTGDTKVVARGQADKVYINTAGVGVVPPDRSVSTHGARPGDAVLVNGFIGDHGAAVMLARGELGLNATLHSDCAPLNGLIESVFSACPHLQVIRDATRGGVGAVLSDIVRDAGVTVALDEASLPVRPETRAICELLGMEALFFANEGLAVFIVPQGDADKVLAVMRDHPYGQHACQIGQVLSSTDPLLYINTIFGGKRMIELPYGVQLPRIC